MGDQQPDLGSIANAMQMHLQINGFKILKILLKYLYEAQMCKIYSNKSMTDLIEIPNPRNVVLSGFPQNLP